jgi:dephospho-CoA kinase
MKQINIIVGGRAYGKTFFARLWMQYHYPELITRQLIRKLAAEAVINISINS